MRKPRMHGLPLRLPGSMVIRSKLAMDSAYIGLLDSSRHSAPPFTHAEGQKAPAGLHRRDAQTITYKPPES